MKNKSKFIIIISIFIVLIGLLSTFAYFTWKSTNNDISFTVNGTIVELNDGKDITGANLMPTLKYTSTGNINKPIKIRLKEETTDTVTVTMNLKINTIDAGLKDASFKYTLVNGSTIIKEGNFASATNGSTITLATLTNTSTTNKLTTTASTYNLYIWIDGTMDNPSTMMNKSFDFSLDITGSNSSMEKVGPANFVEELDDGTTGDSGSGVYKVEHDAIASGDSASGNDIKPVTDYRYYGSDPNNYICLDMGTSSTCPDRSLYRIIGSIYEENAKKNLIKVIKATPITDGTTSTLMTLLNSGAWWGNTSGSYYNNSKTATTVNFTDKGLTDDAKEMVNESLYYLGGWNSGEIKSTEMYGYERGKKTYSGNTLSWTGKVGLMYPSDYGYAAGNDCATNTNLNSYGSSCYTKDWLHNSNYQWLMSPDSSTDFVAFYLTSYGFVDNNVNGRNVFDTLSLHPVFYLKSTVNITSGTGTSQDPYILS